MTRDEFEARYAARSGITIAQLHAYGRYAELCRCDGEGCEGWAMGPQQEDAIAENETRHG